MGDFEKKLEKMIGAREAAQALGCSDRTLKYRAERGQVPAMKIGNRWMFLPSVLDSWRREQLMSNCSTQTENGKEQYGR